MNEDAMIGVYGLFQQALRNEGHLGSYGQPINNKNDDESDVDTKQIYRFLSEYLRGMSEAKLNLRKEVFNNIVRGLTKEYYLNTFLLGIFILENFVGEEGSVPQKITLLPKINRLIKHMQKGIIETQDDPLNTIRDSKLAASNICSLFRGGIETTKAMRKWKVDSWRKAAREQYA